MSGRHGEGGSPLFARIAASASSPALHAAGTRIACSRSKSTHIEIITLTPEGLQVWLVYRAHAQHGEKSKLVPVAVVQHQQASAGDAAHAQEASSCGI